MSHRRLNPSVSYFFFCVTSFRTEAECNLIGSVLEVAGQGIAENLPDHRDAYPNYALLVAQTMRTSRHILHRLE